MLHADALVRAGADASVDVGVAAHALERLVVAEGAQGCYIVTLLSFHRIVSFI